MKRSLDSTADEMVTEVVADLEDNIRSLPPVKDTVSSNLLNRIWAVQRSDVSYSGPSQIRDVLQVGEMYDVVSIKEAYTRHGPIQIWGFKRLKDATIKKVFSCSELHRFTSDDEGRLDRAKRNEMIKHVRIVYKGYQKLPRVTCLQNMISSS